MTEPPNEDPAVAPESSSEEAMPLDAIVGGFEDIRKDAPIAEDPAVFRLAVFVKGDSDADTMGLADDVRLLLDAFVRDPAAVERERSAAAPAPDADPGEDVGIRSEEHTSELQSPYDLVCRLLLEKKKK